MHPPLNISQPIARFTCLPPRRDIAVAQEVTTRLFQRAAPRSNSPPSEVLSGQGVRRVRASVDRQIGADTWQRLLDYSRKQRMSNFGLEDSGPRQIALDQIVIAKKEPGRVRSNCSTTRRLIGRPPANPRRSPRKTSSETRSFRQESTTAQGCARGGCSAAIREGRTNPWFVKNLLRRVVLAVVGMELGGDIVAVKHNIEIIYSLNFPGPTSVASSAITLKYENFDAGDFDACNLNVVSEVGFWYHPPQPGQRRGSRSDVGKLGPTSIWTTSPECPTRIPTV